MTAPRTLQPSTATAPPRAGRAILGGSFNPPHVGHLRLAIEAAEALSSLTDGVDLIPCAVPPHKAMTGMLPFENMVADYVKETDNHVLYQVTPIFDGDNLVASGVLTAMIFSSSA